MKNLFWIWSVCAMLPLFCSCSKDEADLSCSISGAIYDGRTNEPLAGASVTLSPGAGSKSTGSDGQYAFGNLEAGSYTVQGSRTGYQSEQRSVSVEAGGNITVDLHLQPSVAELGLSHETVDFGNEATTMTLDIKNNGYAPLNWQVSEDISWLTCTPVSGTTQQGEKSSVILNVDRTGMDRGSYSQTIAISSNGGSATVRVSMAVQGVGLGISPSELDFGPTLTNLQLTLTNNTPNSGTIAYAIEPSDSWMTVNKRSGIVMYNDIITATVSRAGLSAGDYAGTLRITANNEEFLVKVRMNVPNKECPIVTLSSVDNIQENTASFHGSVTSIGSSPVIRHGFCWSKRENPDISVGTVANLGGATSPKDANYNATALEESTVYYVRAYAENSEGISYSNQKIFTTKGSAKLAQVATGSVSSITSSQAIAEGTLTDLGGNGVEIVQYGHVWSTGAEPTIYNSATRLGSTMQTGPFKSTLTGLSPNTAYHVRAYATNERGTAYGDETVFTTLCGEVNLTTIAASAITHNAVTCGGSISDKGGNTITERGVCIAKTANPSTNDQVAGASDSNDRFTVRVEGLAERTTYHARAYVKTREGKTYYGNDITFTTSHEIHLPSSDGTTVTAVTTHSATFWSAVTGDGDGKIQGCGFCYAKHSAPTLADLTARCTATTGSFTATADQLTENTTYYVRSFVTNEAGTTYGAESNFATLEILPPTLSAVSTVRLTHRSATFQATVTGTNNGTLRDAGFVYSNSGTPDLSHHRLSCGASTSLNGTATDLIPSTTYHVRAYATNEKGTAYSEEITVTTKEKPQDTTIDTGDYDGENDWNK